MTNEIVPPISRTVTRTLGVQILLQQSTDRVSLLLSNSSKLLENDVFTEGALRPSLLGQVPHQRNAERDPTHPMLPPPTRAAPSNGNAQRHPQRHADSNLQPDQAAACLESPAMNGESHVPLISHDTGSPRLLGIRIYF